jgi:signal transduction histidine kinase
MSVLPIRSGLSRAWRGRKSLRARLTVVASIVITLAIVIGMLLMYVLQMNSVRQNLNSELRTYAAEIAQAATGTGWPSPLPRSSLDATAEAQVLAADGSVLASTRALVGLPAVYSLPAGNTQPVRLPTADEIIPESAIVVGTRTTVNGVPVTIITGTYTSLLDAMTSEFGRSVLIGLPIILILSAVAVWMIVGRVLRPVEEIRRSVDDITSDDLSRRVPEPATADDEIGQLASTMNKMLARLEASAVRQRRFVADASHELRSPLAAIRTTLEVGLAHPDSAPWPVIADRAAEQAERLETLIQQLLLLAKADEGKPAADEDDVDLSEVLSLAVASSRPGDMRLRADVEPDLAVAGNAQHLGRLFGNILDNAIRHTATTVAVAAYRLPAAIVVEIVDDGPGIAEPDRERVFERFVRLDSSRSRPSGNSGLGLAIAADIARAHGGSISIADAPGRGARFVVILPPGPVPIA